MCARIITAFGLGLLTTQAQASNCSQPYHPAEDIKNLESSGAQLAAMGIEDDGSMLRIYINPDTRNFSIAKIQPDGKACVIDTGPAIDIHVPPKGDPS